MKEQRFIVTKSQLNRLVTKSGDTTQSIIELCNEINKEDSILRERMIKIIGSIKVFRSAKKDIEIALKYAKDTLEDTMTYPIVKNQKNVMDKANKILDLLNLLK